jgi:hypothetical protein
MNRYRLSNLNSPICSIFHQYLESIQDDVAEYKQEFLNKAAITGRVSYAPLLKEAGDLWKECGELYDAGIGYRVNISDVLLAYFERNQNALETTAKVGASLAERSGSKSLSNPSGEVG